jgi:TRAP-type C4-dicarboxylate transport system permease small subunit
LNELYQQLPEFWRGVLSSIAAALIFALAGLLAKIFWSSAREAWAARRQKLQALRGRLISADPSVRIEANIQLIFSVLMWITIAGICWFVPDMLRSVVEIDAILVVKVGSLIAIIIALRNILLYQNRSDVPRRDLEEVITGTRFRLVYKPPDGSKIITFASQGKIIDGHNENETTWRLNGDKLEILNCQDKVFSRFRYDARTRTFMHTGDADTLSLKNQYIHPEPE